MARKADASNPAESVGAAEYVAPGSAERAADR